MKNIENSKTILSIYYLFGKLYQPMDCFDNRVQQLS